MKRALAFVETVSAQVAAHTAQLGARVSLDASILDRGDGIALHPPGAQSANRSCRLIATRDGWAAVNLPRADDVALIPALIQRELRGDVWASLQDGARLMTCAELVARGAMLGLAVAAVGETAASEPCRVDALSGPHRRTKLRVVDFSSLWAGPLCGSVFAAMGAGVVKLESVERPDTTPHALPLLDRQLNGAKTRRMVALHTREGRAALLDEIANADVLITSARARALTELGVTHEFCASRPGLIWIAITGHGFDNERVAFGDDAAASGGLVRWRDGEPLFIGDAVADPLTGLAAARAGLDLIARGEGGFVDAAMARTAAYVAALK